MNPIVYRIAPNARRKLIMSAAGILAFPLLLAIYGLHAGDRAVLASAGFVALIMAPFIAYIAWRGARPRLELDTAGISVHGALGRTPVRVAWPEIEAIHLGPGRAGVVLVRSLDTPAASSLADYADSQFNGAPFYGDNEARWIADRRWLPFDAFVGWFEAGKLRDDVARFAPALAAQIDAERPRAAAVRRAGHRALIATAVASAGVIAIIVAWALATPARPPAAETWIERIIASLVAIAFLASGIASLVAGARLLRAARVGAGALRLALALVQIGVVMAALAHLTGGGLMQP